MYGSSVLETKSKHLKYSSARGNNGNDEDDK